MPDGDRPVPVEFGSAGKKIGGDRFRQTIRMRFGRAAKRCARRAFWLLVITFGISSMGVTGLNLHVYSYVTDIGYSPWSPLQ